MLDVIDATLGAARPRVLAALLRYFRDLDTAELAFQEACLKALEKWPDQGPPPDPAAWLVLVGRNSGVDALRRGRAVVPPAADAGLAERLDDSHYADDILRLLYVCCHPQLPALAQIALALRIVSGFGVAQIARAFQVGEPVMEQRIAEARARVAAAHVPFEAPGAAERAARLEAVEAMIYLLFNEGHSASGAEAEQRAVLCEEAIRLARLLLRLFPSEPEVLGLTALLLLQHSRAAARLDDAGRIVLLEAQDRSLWDRRMIEEGLALLDEAMRHRQPGPYQAQAAIGALHASAATAAETDWAMIDRLYETLERLRPSPVVTLNRAMAVSRTEGPRRALALIEPLAAPLDGYFYFHGLRGALLKQLGDEAGARAAFDRAIALAGSVQEAAQLRAQLEALARGHGA